MLLDSEDFDHTASSEIVKDVWFGPRELQRLLVLFCRFEHDDVP